MEIGDRKIESLNSLLLVLYIYLSTLTLPLKVLTDSGSPVWVITLLIVSISLYINKFKINIKVFFLIIIIFLLFLINYLIVDFKEEVWNIFIEFIKFGLIPLYLASLVNNYNDLLRHWYTVSLFNIFIWLFFIGGVNERSVNYMTLGRHMTLSFIVFTIYFYKNIKVINLILMLYSLLIITFFANRSSLLVCIVILIFFEMKSLKNKGMLYSYVKSSLYLFACIFIYLKMENLVIILRDTLQSYGINSYILTKAIFAFRHGIEESTSGRDSLYDQSLDIIKENNFMPKGIGYYQYTTGIVYPHNIFIDISITYGIFGLIAFICILIWAFCKSIRINNQSFKLVIITLFIYTFIRLNFSGMFWSDEILLVLVGLVITAKRRVMKKNDSLNI